MLLSLPLEILQEIFFNVRYLRSYCDYQYNWDIYINQDEECPPGQQDILNLSVTCRFLRQAITPIIWQHIDLDITGLLSLNFEARGSGLFMETGCPGSLPSTSFLKCSWIDENVFYFTDNPYHSGRDMSVFLKTPNSMDPVLKYVKDFIIRTEGKLVCRRGGFEKYPEALNRYLLAFRLVNPQMMPLLESLAVQIVVDKLTHDANADLGRVLGTFDEKIRLSLTIAASKEYQNKVSYIDLLCPSGLLPFVVDLTVPYINCTERSSLQLVNVEGLTFSRSLEMDSLNMRSAPFFAAGSSSITFLDVSSWDDSESPQLNRIPPTIRILKGNANLLMLPDDEEKQYQVYDNVFSLTLYFDGDLIPVYDNHKLFFRNLTELHFYRNGVERVRPHGYITVVLCSLLDSTRKSLVSLNISRIFREEFVQISFRFGQLKTLSYDLVLPTSKNNGNSLFLSNALSTWGPDLCLLRYEVTGVYEPSRTSNIHELDMKAYLGEAPSAHIAYSEFRTQVLKHPKLRLIAVHFMDKSGTSEHALFGTSFRRSQDSKHFCVAEFCKGAPPDEIYVDIDKLRVLISRVELEKPLLHLGHITHSPDQTGKKDLLVCDNNKINEQGNATVISRNERANRRRKRK